MPAWLQQILMSAGVFTVLGSVVRGLSLWPKTRGEGNKAQSEGKQAEASGQLSLTEAQIKAQQNALASAESAAKRAEEACLKCEKSREKDNEKFELIEANFKRFIGIVDDELVAELPTPEKRARARAAIREAWQGM